MGQWVSQGVTGNIFYFLSFYFFLSFYPFIFYLSRENYWFHCNIDASLESKYNSKSNHDP